MNIRQVCFICTLSIINLTTALLYAQPDKTNTPLGVLQGPTSEKSTVISILIPKQKNYTWSITNKSDAVVNFQKTVTSINKNWKQLHLSSHNLDKNETYKLRIFEKEKLVDHRFFQTLNLSSSNAKIIVASCLRDSAFLENTKNAKKIYKKLENSNADAIFLIGDNLYVRQKKVVTTPKSIVKQHIQSRNLLPVYKMRNLIPIFSIWDDNDYGKSNGGRDFVHKDFSKKIFRSFFPSNSKVVKNGPGISFYFDAWKRRFIFLDNRFFRNNKNKMAPYGLWGKTQQLWMLKAIKKSNYSTWLIDGGQFFGAYHPFESLAGSFPKNFTSVMKEIQKNSSATKPVSFVSGDRHLTEFMNIPSKVLGYSTWEATSSPLHSTLYPQKGEKKFINPYQTFGLDDKYNFVEFELSKSKTKMRVISHDGVETSFNKL